MNIEDKMKTLALLERLVIALEKIAKDGVTTQRRMYGPG